MSNKIRVNFHSFVDIITNSSTVIYTYVNSVEAVKEFINAVLQISGAHENYIVESEPVTADDLYDFKTVLSSSAVERVVDFILDSGDHEHYAALNAINEDPKYGGWGGKWSALRDYVRENVAAEDAPYDYYYGNEPETELVITPKKPGYREDLGKLLEAVFSHRAEYDG